MKLRATNEAVLSARQRRAVLEVIQSRFGIRDSDYGASRIDAAVQSVLPTTEYTDVDSMLASLAPESMPRWLFELVEYLTVGETYFLRDPAQILALRETILPDVINRRGTERRLRMWSAGCSTGEEVYTLAILLKERNLASDWDISLVGTDVNRESLRVAREARYPAWSFRSTPETVRDRYFEPISGDWRLQESLRRMARFAWANLGSELLMPPLSDADLVVCRNVTIYFDDVATQRLYNALVSALAPGGWLMLGPSDPLPADTRGLERIEAAQTVLWRRLAAPRTERPRSVPPTTPQVLPRLPRPRTAAPKHVAVPGNEMEAGLLALEAGSAGLALELLRRATFHYPDSALAQFGLARAYVALGDRARAQAALIHTRRLLLHRSADELVPGSDSMAVETLRQTVATYLEELGL
jgi:chemotaxis methyl-accepting protein methylase